MTAFWENFEVLVCLSKHILERDGTGSLNFPLSVPFTPGFRPFIFITAIFFLQIFHKVAKCFSISSASHPLFSPLKYPSTSNSLGLPPSYNQDQCIFFYSQAHDIWDCFCKVTRNLKIDFTRFHFKISLQLSVPSTLTQFKCQRARVSTLFQLIS